MNNILDGIKKNISIKETTKYYQTCNCCENIGKIELSFMRNKNNGTSGTVITLCEEHIKILKEQLDQEDVYKKCWEELKMIIKEDEEPALFNLLSDSNRNSLKYKMQEIEKHNIKEVE